jgi:hypothetical protein
VIVRSPGTYGAKTTTNAHYTALDCESHVQIHLTFAQAEVSAHQTAELSYSGIEEHGQVRPCAGARAHAPVLGANHALGHERIDLAIARD